MSKLKKTLLIITGTIVAIVVAIIIFISPIAKYVIQKYDVKFLGREITLNWIYINPFTGYVHIDDMKVFENKTDSVFFSTSGISVNFEMFKLLSKKYIISDFTLTAPHAKILQDKASFNFDDIIKRFAPKDSLPKPKSKEPTKFSLMNVNITDGLFYYREKQTPVNYYIKKVNIESTGLQWDVDTIATKFSLQSGVGTGNIKGNITLNTKTNDYKLAVTVRKFELDIFGQYLKDLINYGSFRANLDADVKSSGNLKDQKKMTTSGLIVVNDFHFGKSPKEDYLAFNKLAINIIKVSPKNHIYKYDSLSIMQPYFKFERYDSLDNIQRMFGKKGANVKAANADPAKFNLVIELAKTIKVISRNFFSSKYQIGKIAIYGANLKYDDYSLSEKFSASLNPFTFYADSINKEQKRVDCVIKSGIKPYGHLGVTVSINPKDSTDFNIKCGISNIPLSMFNPFVIKYTSFPLDRGTLEFNANWRVVNGMVNSSNHLVIVDPRTTKRLKNKDTKWIPVPLIMAFVRERGNVIDYEIPVTGNIKNPEFHFKDAIFDLIDNIFVKPATIPYRMEVKSTENEIEKSLSLKWQTRNDILESKQEKFIDRMVDFLKDNPNAIVDVYPQHYITKEKEYILLFEAKKKYFFHANHRSPLTFTESDSEEVAKMSIKDNSFIKYLNTHLNGAKNIFTVQEKCTHLIDANIVNAKYAALNEQRMHVFLAEFKDKKVDNRVKFMPSEDLIPYNGFSFYKIKYKGEFPESLVEAYEKMSEYNDESPRKKFKKEHKSSLKKL